MKRFEVHWVDNEFSSLQQEVDFISSLGKIHVEPIDSIGDYLQNEFTSDLPDLLILDLEMTTKGDSKTKDEYWVFNLFKHDSIRCPCIIYTHNIHRLELKESYVTNNRYLLGCYQKGKETDVFLKAIENLLLFPKHTIVHLSDIHYDSKSPKKVTQLLDSFSSTLSKIDADSIMITGDLADKNLKEDYNQLSPILKRIFSSKFGGDYENNLFVIPGNHDFEWADYKTSKMASRPYLEYQNFISSLMPSQKTNVESTNIETCWSKSFNNLKVIGLNSSVEKSDKKGKGVLLEEHEELIEKEWLSVVKPKQEIRVLLIHHNIFLPLSRNSDEEQEQMENGGMLFQLLLMAKCDLVLSGHTHLPYLVNFGGASYTTGNSEYQKFRSFYNFASGTFGNYTSGYDKPNYFSTIELIPDMSSQIIEWKILFNTYQYESTLKRWEKSSNPKSLKLSSL